MGKKKIVQLTTEQVAELEKGYRKDLLRNKAGIWKLLIKMAQLSDWSKFDEIRKSKAIERKWFQAVVRSQKRNICRYVWSGQRSFQSVNKRQKVRIIDGRSSFIDAFLLAGISDDVSFRTGCASCTNQIFREWFRKLKTLFEISKIR